MKIVGGDGSFACSENLHAIGFHGNDIVDILQAAFDQEKFTSNNCEAILLKNVGRDDCIRDAGLVFETQEHETFGGAGTLSSDDSAGNQHVSAVANVVEGDGAKAS